MSTIKHPVGPQTNKVYWRRRLVVLLGLLAVIVLIVLIVVGPGRSAGAEKPAGGAPGASETAVPGSTPVTTPADAGAACTAGTVAVEAVTDASDYSGDQQPALSLAVTNTGDVACSLNVGTAAQVFTVKSGEDVYWTSTDCQTDASDIPLELKPGQTVKSSTPILWERTRSAPDTCDSDERESAAAGGASYHLVVSIDGISSTSSKQFILN